MFTDKSQMGRSRTYRQPAPGGRRSPQKPGMTPDYSTITGQANDVAPPATTVRRPISQYGTAQEIMQVFTPGADGVWDKTDFEQAPTSNEEQRKALPTALTPIRPVPGFALGESSGTDLAALMDAGKQGE
jgi:hypothetical protein